MLAASFLAVRFSQRMTPQPWRGSIGGRPTATAAPWSGWSPLSAREGCRWSRRHRFEVLAREK